MYPITKKCEDIIGSTTDPSDIYSGLDRFGRIIDHRWISTNSGIQSGTGGSPVSATQNTPSTTTTPANNAANSGTGGSPVSATQSIPSATTTPANNATNSGTGGSPVSATQNTPSATSTASTNNTPTSSSPSTPPLDLDRYQYGYNAASQRLWRRNVVSAAQTTPVYLDELYSYDGLNQVSSRQQGQLSADATAITNTPAQTETWAYDSAGNWNSYNQDTASPSTVVSTARTHNRVNEITAGTAPSLDSYCNSNWKIIEERYIPASDEPINKVSSSSSASSSPSSTSASSSSASSSTPSPAPAAPLRAQYLYDLRSRNDLIFRDANIEPSAAAATATSASTTTPTLSAAPVDSTSTTPSSSATIPAVWQRHYPLTNAMLSTTALTDSTGTILQRYHYTAFGSPTLLTSEFALSAITTPATNATVVATTAATDTGNEWQIFFHGETYDLDTLWGNYGFRYYTPLLGRWITRDPIGEADGLNLYRISKNDIVNNYDHMGLWRIFRDEAEELATVHMDAMDTWEGLAKEARLDAENIYLWVTGYTAIPERTKCYKIPNVILRYWGGHLGVFGRLFVFWPYSYGRGFKYDDVTFDGNTMFDLQKNILAKAAAKTIYGFSYYGHGGPYGLWSAAGSINPFPDKLPALSYEKMKTAKMTKKFYKLGYVALHACYSNYGKELAAEGGFRPGTDGKHIPVFDDIDWFPWNDGVPV